LLHGRIDADKLDLGAGSVRTEALRLMAGAVPIDGAGTIDLGQRTLDYRLTVHRPDALPAQVVISGPWDAPSFARALTPTRKLVARHAKNA
jgi:hypothetical protein